ncbi:MAG TPA: aminodeoxychorismate lyase [Cellvibrionaceae bacterium]|nr:aminodeoxychorismate lyase [Cellvibrionaceae bacterium]HMW71166.1 aminodeoxychorismate lyase [Cellvibrionaceae bacterium]HMY39714.1 aminodeoxychorismate lyase [Marinagarivorans sp.]HNG59237.1 aminodeoxychorismate lyase [Cellvibrionaceae bacterium]
MTAPSIQSDATPITWVNGVRCGQVAIDDRGLAYGDGLFETMRYQAGALPLLPGHLERLTASAQRLNIAVSEAQVMSELELVLNDLATSAEGPIGALKLIVTRGAGVGYTPAPEGRPNYYWLYRRCIEAVAMARQGVALQVSPLRLSRSALLGGLKHLNRLEYVLAAQEPLVAEPPAAASQWLLLDEHGSVIEALTHNIFWLRDGVLFTPQLSHSGVAGVMRQWLLQRAATETRAVTIGTFNLADVLGADEVFICNSLRGIWPVVQIEQTHFNSGPITRHYQSAIDSLWQ